MFFWNHYRQEPSQIFMLKFLIFYTENKYVDENNATKIKSYIHLGGPLSANRP